MAEKKNHTLLIVGLIGIGGIIAYEWWKGSSAATATTTTAMTTTGLPTDGVIAPPSSAVTATAATPSIPANGIDPTVWAVVQKWGTTDGRQPILAMLAAAVPSEYAGMYDIITNYWDKNVALTQTQVDFWNNLRDKYDPTHQSW